MGKIKCAITGAEFQTYYGLYGYHEKIRRWLKNKGYLIQMIEDIKEGKY